MRGACGTHGGRNMLTRFWWGKLRGRILLNNLGTDDKAILTFRHRAFSILDRRFATLRRMLFIYLINKYISLADISLTCIININNINNQLGATITAY